MKYVISDIHGRMDRLEKMLSKIEFSKQDTLYILGDMIDRGDNSIDVIKFAMENDNVVALMGNHDKMMLYSLRYEDEKQKVGWARNGCEQTLAGYNNLEKSEQESILDFLDSLEYYKIVDDKFFLVHAGIDVDQLKEDMKEKNMHDAIMQQERNLVWIRGDFFKKKGLEEYTVIFGHNPRVYIDKEFEEESVKPLMIWHDAVYRDKICIDTANCYEDGRMACLRLDDMSEFYID